MTKLLQKPIWSATIAVMGLFAAFLLFFPRAARALFSAESFMPHVHCYLDNPRMIALHVVSDLLIGLAYISISSTLAYLVYKARRSIPFHWMFLSFGLFIVSCGFTHFMEVFTVWHAYYWLAGWVKVITAVASVVTAIAMFPLVPKIFSMIEAVKVSEDRRVKLADANRELEAFAYSVSHDLRAPLRTMQGMAVALQQDYTAKLDATAQHYTKRIITAAERMDLLIRDLLEYSRMNLGHFQLAAVELKPVIEEVLTSIAVEIRERSAVITLENVSGTVVAHPALLGNVLTNLVINAAKFVTPGTQPQIAVRVETRKTTVRISVTDNGIGIGTDHQQRIFKMFECLHSTAAYPGTGVGLAIVERAIFRMGGKLGVQSQPGQGSCFWIELPSPAQTTG